MGLTPNMYVRTKYGISKIDEDRRIDYGIINPVIDILKEEAIFKASENIIDIVEVGDYVNGCYVSNKRASVNEHLGGHPKGIGIIKCNAYFNQGNYNDCKFEWIEEKDIKSIVTKEMFESMSYKIER